LDGFGGAYWGGLSGVGVIGRLFFFEKKNQKTFDYGTRLSGYGRDSGAKVFCFFSSEKKTFLPLPCPAHQRRLHLRHHACPQLGGGLDHAGDPGCPDPRAA
jgi:hypothetical protein